MKLFELPTNSSLLYNANLFEGGNTYTAVESRKKKKKPQTATTVLDGRANNGKSNNVQTHNVKPCFCMTPTKDNPGKSCICSDIQKAESARKAAEEARRETAAKEAVAESSIAALVEKGVCLGCQTCNIPKGSGGDKIKQMGKCGCNEKFKPKCSVCSKTQAEEQQREEQQTAEQQTERDKKFTCGCIDPFKINHTQTIILKDNQGENEDTKTSKCDCDGEIQVKSPSIPIEKRTQDTQFSKYDVKEDSMWTSVKKKVALFSFNKYVAFVGITTKENELQYTLLNQKDPKDEEEKKRKKEEKRRKAELAKRNSTEIQIQLVVESQTAPEKSPEQIEDERREEERRENQQLEREILERERIEKDIQARVEREKEVFERELGIRDEIEKERRELEEREMQRKEQEMEKQQKELIKRYEENEEKAKEIERQRKEEERKRRRENCKCKVPEKIETDKNCLCNDKKSDCGKPPPLLVSLNKSSCECRSTTTERRRSKTKKHKHKRHKRKISSSRRSGHSSRSRKKKRKKKRAIIRKHREAKNTNSKSSACVCQSENNYQLYIQGPDGCYIKHEHDCSDSQKKNKKKWKRAGLTKKSTNKNISGGDDLSATTCGSQSTGFMICEGKSTGFMIRPNCTCNKPPEECKCQSKKQIEVKKDPPSCICSDSSVDCECEPGKKKKNKKKIKAKKDKSRTSIISSDSSDCECKSESSKYKKKKNKKSCCDSDSLSGHKYGKKASKYSSKSNKSCCKHGSSDCGKKVSKCSSKSSKSCCKHNSSDCDCGDKLSKCGKKSSKYRDKSKKCRDRPKKCNDKPKKCEHSSSCDCGSSSDCSSIGIRLKKKKKIHRKAPCSKEKVVKVEEPPKPVEEPPKPVEEKCACDNPTKSLQSCCQTQTRSSVQSYRKPLRKVRRRRFRTWVDEIQEPYEEVGSVASQTSADNRDSDIAPRPRIIRASSSSGLKDCSAKNCNTKYPKSPNAGTRGRWAEKKEVRIRKNKACNPPPTNCRQSKSEGTSSRADSKHSCSSNVGCSSSSNYGYEEDKKHPIEWTHRETKYYSKVYDDCKPKLTNLDYKCSKSSKTCDKPLRPTIWDKGLKSYKLKKQERELQKEMLEECRRRREWELDKEKERDRERERKIQEKLDKRKHWFGRSKCTSSSYSTASHANSKSALQNLKCTSLKEDRRVLRARGSAESGSLSNYQSGSERKHRAITLYDDCKPRPTNVDYKCSKSCNKPSRKTIWDKGLKNYKIKKQERENQKEMLEECRRKREREREENTSKNKSWFGGSKRANSCHSATYYATSTTSMSNKKCSYKKESSKNTCGKEKLDGKCSSSSLNKKCGSFNQSIKSAKSAKNKHCSQDQASWCKLTNCQKPCCKNDKNSLSLFGKKKTEDCNCSEENKKKIRRTSSDQSTKCKAPEKKKWFQKDDPCPKVNSSCGKIQENCACGQPEKKKCITNKPPVRESCETIKDRPSSQSTRCKLGKKKGWFKNDKQCPKKSDSCCELHGTKKNDCGCDLPEKKKCKSSKPKQEPCPIEETPCKPDKQKGWFNKDKPRLKKSSSCCELHGIKKDACGCGKPETKKCNSAKPKQKPCCIDKPLSNQSIKCKSERKKGWFNKEAPCPKESSSFCKLHGMNKNKCPCGESKTNKCNSSKKKSSLWSLLKTKDCEYEPPLQKKPKCKSNAPSCKSASNESCLSVQSASDELEEKEKKSWFGSTKNKNASGCQSKDASATTCKLASKPKGKSDECIIIICSSNSSNGSSKCSAKSVADNSVCKSSSSSNLSKGKKPKSKKDCEKCKKGRKKKSSKSCKYSTDSRSFIQKILHSPSCECNKCNSFTSSGTSESSDSCTTTTNRSCLKTKSGTSTNSCTESCSSIEEKQCTPKKKPKKGWFSKDESCKKEIICKEVCKPCGTTSNTSILKKTTTKRKGFFAKKTCKKRVSLCEDSICAMYYLESNKISKSDKEMSSGESISRDSYSSTSETTRSEFLSIQNVSIKYSNKFENLREDFLWIHEKSMKSRESTTTTTTTIVETKPANQGTWIQKLFKLVSKVKDEKVANVEHTKITVEDMPIQKTSILQPEITSFLTKRNILSSVKEIEVLTKKVMDNFIKEAHPKILAPLPSKKKISKPSKPMELKLATLSSLLVQAPPAKTLKQKILNKWDKIQSFLQTQKRHKVLIVTNPVKNTTRFRSKDVVCSPKLYSSCQKANKKKKRSVKKSETENFANHQSQSEKSTFQVMGYPASKIQVETSKTSGDTQDYRRNERTSSDFYKFYSKMDLKTYYELKSQETKENNEVSSGGVCFTK